MLLQNITMILLRPDYEQNEWNTKKHFELLLQYLGFCIGLNVHVLLFSPSLAFTVILYSPIYALTYLIYASYSYDFSDTYVFSWVIFLTIFFSLVSIEVFYFLQSRELIRFFQQQESARKEQDVSNVLNL